MIIWDKSLERITTRLATSDHVFERGLDYICIVQVDEWTRKSGRLKSSADSWWPKVHNKLANISDQL